VSSGPKVPWAWARSAAERLAGYWGVLDSAYEIVGSIRRQRPEVGDIELLAPHPGPGGGRVDWARDDLYFAIERRLGLPPGRAGLFRDVLPAGKIGWAVKGFVPSFYYCQLQLTFAGDGERAGLSMSLPVDIFRYDPGERGNKGWIELERTGPREFGVAFLGRWRRHWKLPAEVKASRDGYLRDAQDRAVATPTERECFRLAGLEWIPPERREGARL
jgi:DNA polymerase/3'-5' exonuclease PolX